MPGQVVGYARVSSTSQNLARQLHALRDVEEVFTDEASGASRGARPGLAAALRHVRRGDTLRVASMDRLARSLVDLEHLVADMTDRGVVIEFVKERLTFAPGAGDPFATFQRQLIGSVAELERSLIRERQREGIDLAKNRGAYRGRRRALSQNQVRLARSMVASGVHKTKIAAELGCSRAVLYEALAGRGAYAPTAIERPALAGGGQEVELPL